MARRSKDRARRDRKARAQQDPYYHYNQGAAGLPPQYPSSGQPSWQPGQYPSYPGHNDEEKPVDEILMDLYERRPDVVCFSCYLWNISYVEQIVAELQALGHCADCVVIAGEGHEFTKPANRQRVADLVRDWLLEAWGSAQCRRGEPWALVRD